jgi:hypothetical protein
MRQSLCILMCLFCMTQIGQTSIDKVPQTMPSNYDTEFTYSLEDVVRLSQRMRDWKSLSLEKVKFEGTRENEDVLKRIADLPNLTTLKFFSCDLSQLNENSPIPAKVEEVVIMGGKFSQSTIRWLAKFPSGGKLTFGSCDLRGLNLQTGKFATLGLEDCKIGREAALLLIEKSYRVVFQETIFLEDVKVP